MLLPGADCWTDHRLLRSKLKLKIEPVHRKSASYVKRLDVCKLKHPAVIEQLGQTLRMELNSLPEQVSVDAHWKELSKVVYDASLKALGPRKRKHEDWFNENDLEIQELLKRKHRSFAALRSNVNSVSLKQKYKDACSQTQSALRKMKNDWWDRKADEMQAHAFANNWRAFHETAKEANGPSVSNNAPVMSADGTRLITDAMKQPKDGGNT